MLLVYTFLGIFIYFIWCTATKKSDKIENKFMKMQKCAVKCNGNIENCHHQFILNRFSLGMQWRMPTLTCKCLCMCDYEYVCECEHIVCHK